MFPQIFLQWVRAEVTQRVFSAAQAKVQEELRARANAQAEGPLPCDVGIVTSEVAMSEAMEELLVGRAKFCSDHLSIVQGILPIANGTSEQNWQNTDNGRDRVNNGDEIGDGDSGDNGENGAVKGIRLAIARAGRGRKSALRAIEALVNGHRPKYVIVAGFCTAISKKLHAGDLLLADRFVLYDPQNDVYDRELPLRPYEDDDVTDDPIALLEQKEIPSREESAAEFAGYGIDGKSKKKKENTKKKTKKEASRRGVALRSGPLVTVSRLAGLPKTPKSKRRLGGLSDALAADTMSEPVARYCLRRQLPVLVLSGVREEVEESFPEDVRHYQRHGTKLGRLGAAVGAFLNREGAMTELNRWNQRGRELSERLADTVVAIVQDGMR